MRLRRTTRSKRTNPIVGVAFLSILLVVRSYLLSQWKNASFSYVTSSSLLYDPKNCTKIKNGHCADENGGAWTYRNENGGCVYREGHVPGDVGARDILPVLFPEVSSVLDFGGGVGSFLTRFREKGVSPLVVVEPQPLGDCLFKGLQQDTTDWINTPLSRLPVKKYDLVMTIEVVEHIPLQFHTHLIKALAQATKRYVLFSAAHPGQAGDGHVGPSMKWRDQWIEEIHNWTSLRQDPILSLRFQNVSSRILRRNSAIFRKDTANET